MKKLFFLIYGLMIIGMLSGEGCTVEKSEPTKIKVEINNTGYVPGTLAVVPPTEVTWVNKDTVSHSVTSGIPEHIKFDSGIIKPGSKFQLEFTEEMLGTYEYHSTINGDEDLNGTIVVNEEKK